jgi:Skp family chaperone for outer membrane proteins
MRTHSTRRRSAARMLSLAAAAGLGMYHNADDDKGGAGGTTTTTTTTDDKGGKKGDEPEKLTLTQAELDGQIQAALATERQKADAAAKRKADEDKRKADEEQGKWKELSETEQKRNAELAAENRTLKTELALGKHLALKHPDYVGKARWSLPLIPADTADDAIADAVTKAADEFIKDNAVQPKGAAGAPPAPRGGNLKPGGQTQVKPNGQQRPRVGVADGF